MSFLEDPSPHTLSAAAEKVRGESLVREALRASDPLTGAFGRFRLR